jgi:hypothetical protein
MLVGRPQVPPPVRLSGWTSPSTPNTRLRNQPMRDYRAGPPRATYAARPDRIPPHGRSSHPDGRRGNECGLIGISLVSAAASRAQRKHRCRHGRSRRRSIPANAQGLRREWPERVEGGCSSWRHTVASRVSGWLMGTASRQMKAGSGSSQQSVTAAAGAGVSSTCCHASRPTAPRPTTARKRREVPAVVEAEIDRQSGSPQSEGE